MLDFFTPEIVWNIILVCIGILVILNIILNFNRIKNDTINNRLNLWANGKFFFITFFWGVLGGHFFLGSEKPMFCCNSWLPVIIIIILSAILFFIGIRLPKKFKIKQKYQVVLMITGLLYGHFVWSQRHEPIALGDKDCKEIKLFCKDE